MFLDGILRTLDVEQHSTDNYPGTLRVRTVDITFKLL
jgi:hypothetical protein